MSLATFEKLNRYAIRQHRYRIFSLLQEVLSNSATLRKEQKGGGRKDEERGERRRKRVRRGEKGRRGWTVPEQVNV